MTLTLVRDGREQVFAGSPVLSVLVSAQRAEVALRHDCGGKAQCGTCRVRVLEGRGGPLLPREAERLAAVGADADMRLACQLRPASDMRLQAVLPLA